jgi:hypothetical protein
LRPQFRGDEVSGMAFGPEVQVSDDAPVEDRLAAFFGRHPGPGLSNLAACRSHMSGAMPSVAQVGRRYHHANHASALVEGDLLPLAALRSRHFPARVEGGAR